MAWVRGYPRTDSSLQIFPENFEIYNRVQRYPSVSIPPGTVTEKIIHGGTLWNNLMSLCSTHKGQTPSLIILYWGEPERAPH